MNDLVELPERQSAIEVYKTKNGLEPFLQKIRDEIDAFVPDVATAKGRKEIASIANKVARSKTALDNLGKELVAELKATPKLIDAERKRMRDTLDAWKEEVRKPLTDIENAEKLRIETHERNVEEIQKFSSLDFLSIMDNERLREKIDYLQNLDINESFEEYETAALKARDSSLLVIKGFIAQREEEEKKAAEAQALREERIRIEAEERMRREAEQAEQRIKQEAELKAQRAKQEAEAELQRVKREAEMEAQRVKEEAEQAKFEAEQAAKREEAERLRREADKEHQKNINNEALACFIKNGVEEEVAKKVITLIARGMIKNLKVVY